MENRTEYFTWYSLELLCLYGRPLCLFPHLCIHHLSLQKCNWRIIISRFVLWQNEIIVLLKVSIYVLYLIENYHLCSKWVLFFSASILAYLVTNTFSKILQTFKIENINYNTQFIINTIWLSWKPANNINLLILILLMFNVLE